MKAPLLLCLAAPLALAHGEAGRGRYQPIIDAKPFGDMAQQVSAEAAADAAEQQRQREEIAQKFRMVGITDLPDGSRKIAFLDETGGAFASYLLGVGETQNGFTLVEADYDAEWATLAKDGLTFTLGLGKGLIEKPAPAASSAALRAAPSAPRPARRAQAPAQGSFRDRLLRREAAKAQAEAKRREAIGNEIAAENAKIIEAQTQAAARRLQIERIKQGLPPTRPITLTAEEDAELEAAGVFDRPQAAPAAQPEPPDEALPPANP